MSTASVSGFRQRVCLAMRTARRGCLKSPANYMPESSNHLDSGLQHAVQNPRSVTPRASL